ncbi:MAG: YbaK/EbsC family protein, partial [Anaerolineae bacterium]
MRFSTLLGKTLRDPPSEAHLASHQLLVRAAMVRDVAPGIFAYLPLGRRAMRRLGGLARRELASAGGQEIDLPPMPEGDPATALVGLVEREVDSYRQLPLLVFYPGAVPEPEPAVREGLFGAAGRPAVAVQVFEGEGLAEAPQRVEEALARVLDACGVEVVWAEVWAGGRRAYLPHPAGDEEMAHCRACGYAAERSWATAAWPAPPDEPALPPEEIETPDCNTIAALAEFLEIPESKTLKMVFYSVEGDVTCVVIRGDRSVDEAKLARALGTDWYYASMAHELEAVGAVGGYASPIGLDQAKLQVVADPSVRSGVNFVSGANRPDYHIKNVNVPRDFEPGAWVDLALVEAGDACPACGGPLAVAPAFALIEKGPAGPCAPGAE